VYKIDVVGHVVEVDVLAHKVLCFEPLEGVLVDVGPTGHAHRSTQNHEQTAEEVQLVSSLLPLHKLVDHAVICNFVRHLLTFVFILQLTIVQLLLSGVRLGLRLRELLLEQNFFVFVFERGFVGIVVVLALQ